MMVIILNVAITYICILLLTKILSSLALYLHVSHEQNRAILEQIYNNVADNNSSEQNNNNFDVINMQDIKDDEVEEILYDITDEVEIEQFKSLVYFTIVDLLSNIIYIITATIIDERYKNKIKLKKLK